MIALVNQYAYAGDLGGVLIKRILDHDVERHTITIHSLNSFYPDRTLDLREVRQIFNVIEMSRPRRR